MIVLPDEDEEPVGAQVNAVIGEALRQSVAGVDVSPGFEARLAAALDAIERGGQPAPLVVAVAGAMGSADEADQAGVAAQESAGAGPAATGQAGQGSEAAEAAS